MYMVDINLNRKSKNSTSAADGSMVRGRAKKVSSALSATGVKASKGTGKISGRKRSSIASVTSSIASLAWRKRRELQRKPSAASHIVGEGICFGGIEGGMMWQSSHGAEK